MSGVSQLCKDCQVRWIGHTGSECWNCGKPSVFISVIYPQTVPAS